MQISNSQDQRFFDFVETELAVLHDPTARVLSVLDKKGEILAVCLYSGWTPYGCEMRIASTSPRWATRRTIQAFLAYPFQELGLRRVLAATDTSNPKSVQMLLRLGFKLEGLLRYWKGEDHALLYGMLKEECKWL